MKPVRFSRLKVIGQSPAHYFGQFELEREDNAQLRFGRLVHALVLGGKIAVYPGERRGKVWGDFEAANQGAEIVTSPEYARGEKVAAAVLRHPDAALLVGEREKELAWMLEGRACGARLDVLGAGYVTELKTTTSAEPGWFVRNGSRMAYHAQLSWYMTAARMCYPSRSFDAAYIIAVETKHPYVVTSFEVPQRALDLGARLWRSWWETLIGCETSNQWPPYVQSRATFDPSADVELTYGDEG
jgi:hypothetical protein